MKTLSVGSIVSLQFYTIAKSQKQRLYGVLLDISQVELNTVLEQIKLSCMVLGFLKSWVDVD